ncbi:hypothetical protein SCOCK_170136 [Actinacidiphila cocklensis]|uniref:Uncharacterized protein n=1 Tax=Actinacidiphila cocklensis TaxID=887465 RepID=A0A9W4GPP0_9ACTN|nr:hypothetical protein SCOCK_170136 [Actinacidiphila cocklensis]
MIMCGHERTLPAGSGRPPGVHKAAGPLASGRGTGPPAITYGLRRAASVILCRRAPRPIGWKGRTMREESGRGGKHHRTAVGQREEAAA